MLIAYRSTADLLLCLLSHIQFDDADTIPLTLLHLIDDYLRQYPMQSQDIYPAINIIDALSQCISTCSARSITLVLKGLQNGICTWNAATPEVVPDDEYNQYVSHYLLIVASTIHSFRADNWVLSQLSRQSILRHGFHTRAARSRRIPMLAFR